LARLSEGLNRVKEKKIAAADKHRKLQIKNINDLYEYEVSDATARYKRAYEETQERLITRIALACAAYPAVKTIEICLKKCPVRTGSGSLGIRLTLNETETQGLRAHKPQTNF
jgi:hypothetical protein